MRDVCPPDGCRAPCFKPSTSPYLDVLVVHFLSLRLELRSTLSRNTRDRFPRLTGLWRNPDFMKLWTGQTVSEFGSVVTRDALPLVALLVLGASPAQMGLVAATGALPALVFGLAAGVWVDRVRRRPIMIAADLGRALLLLTIPAAALLGHLVMSQLYAVGVLVGALTIFFNVAYQSYLPSLVERENIVEGNAKLALSSSAAEIGGSGLAGVLVQAFTAPFAVLLDALSYLVSVASVAFIRKPEPPPRPPLERGHLLREVRDGFGFVVRQPVLRAFAGVSGIETFFGSFYAALYGLYAIRVLGLGPAGLGIVIAMGGVGSLAGALLAERAGRRFPLGAVLIGSLAVGTVVSIFTPLARGPVAVAAASLIVGQFFGDMSRTIYEIHQVSLRQAITPDRLLGRANASMQMLNAALGPLGALVGGWLGGKVGPRNTLWLAVAGLFLSLPWLIFSPVRRLREMPQTVDEP
jgi:MFS family permease